MSGDTTMTCIHCGYSHTGKYCGGCGTRNPTRRSFLAWAGAVLGLSTIASCEMFAAPVDNSHVVVRDYEFKNDVEFDSYVVLIQDEPIGKAARPATPSGLKLTHCMTIQITPTKYKNTYYFGGV